MILFHAACATLRMEKRCPIEPFDMGRVLPAFLANPLDSSRRDCIRACYMYLVSVALRASEDRLSSQPSLPTAVECNVHLRIRCR